MSDKPKRSRKHRGNRRNKKNKQKNDNEAEPIDDAASSVADKSNNSTPPVFENDADVIQVDVPDPPNVDVVPDPPNIDVVPSFETISEIQLKQVEIYTVESPKQTLKPTQKKKLQNAPKSKSLDNEDDCVLNIVEIEAKSSDEDKSLVENNAIITEAESDVEWEVADNLKNSSEELKSSGDELKNCGDEPKNAGDEKDAAQKEIDLREFLQTLNLVSSPVEVSQKPVVVPEVKIKPCENSKEPQRDPSVNDMKLRKAQKKAALEEHVIAQYLRPRYLDIIDEEGSNESGETTRRDSLHSPKYVEDFDDDVFITEKKVKEPLEFFPKHKDYLTCKKDLKRQQECKLVGAKIIESEFEEGCGSWTIENTEQRHGAEIVYLDDSSSSTSENNEGTIDDINESEIQEAEERVNIKTPIIELNTQCVDGSNSIPVISDMNFNYSAPADAPKDETCQESISLQTVPITPENAFATNEELIESLENLLVNVPTPVACNEVIMLANEFVDELPIVTEVLKESKSSHEIEKACQNVSNDIPNIPLHIEENNADSLSSCTSGEESKDGYSRHDSSSSVCSSSHSNSSHSTAKYNPLSSSLTDIDALTHDDIVPNGVSKERTMPTTNTCCENVTGEAVNKVPSPLKELCVGKIAGLSYGGVILKELAAVSQSLSDFATEALSKEMTEVQNLPPEPPIKRVLYKPRLPPALHLEKIPPPVAPRQSSFKLLQEEPSWIGLQSQRDPSLVAYLSPLQKKQIETTKNYSSDEAGELIDMHRKYAERKCYGETTFANSEKSPSSSNNNDDKIAVQVERPAPDTGNRLLAIIRDPSVNPNVQHADDSIAPSSIESSFDFIETLRTFEDMNKDLSNDHRFRTWTKKDGNVKESFEIAEHLSTDKSYKAVAKPGKTDIIDFNLKPIKENVVFDKDSITIPATNGNDNKKSNERIVNITIEDKTKCASDSAKNDASNKMQSLLNRREFLLDDPIFKNDIFSMMKETVSSSSTAASTTQRRGSLPKEIHDRQIQYILQKEKEIQEQIRQLEEEKRSANFGISTVTETKSSFALNENNNNTVKESERSITVNGKQTHFESSKECQKKGNASVSAPSEGEKFREQMYSEYMDKVAEREERKQNRVIKITSSPSTNETIIPIVRENPKQPDPVKKNVGSDIEEEFILRAKERWEKLGFKDPEPVGKVSPVVMQHKIVTVVDVEGEKDVKKLPTHLQEFVEFTSNGDQSGECGSNPKRSYTSLVVICPIVVVLLAVVKRFWSSLDSNVQ